MSRPPRERLALIAAMSLLVFISCVGQRESAPEQRQLLSSGDGTQSSAPSDSGISNLALQAHVMSMADDYTAGLSEAVYVIVRDANTSPKCRWLAQSFLRNGTGAAVDIAVGANPPVALLDLLVLSSLQTWSFGEHWIEKGIGEESGLPALVRLRKVERELWKSSERYLRPEQQERLRVLVQNWIKENPDRMVVSLVRFSDFEDLRRSSGLNPHDEATGLLEDLVEATEVAEDIELLGERVLWFAGRLPYILGQQTELTTYRLADQPEAELVRDTLISVEKSLGSVAMRMDSLRDDVTAQRQGLMADLGRQRTEAIEDLAQRVTEERKRTIDQAFERLAQERRSLFDDFDARQNSLEGSFEKLGGTVSASTELARELKKTIDALDRLLARFDKEPVSADQPNSSADGDEPLDIDALTVAAIESSKAAREMAKLLEQTVKTIENPALLKTLQGVKEAEADVVDHLFWRVAALIILVFAGFAGLRFLPKR